MTHPFSRELIGRPRPLSKATERRLNRTSEIPCADCKEAIALPGYIVCRSCLIASRTS